MNIVLLATLSFLALFSLGLSEGPSELDNLVSRQIKESQLCKGTATYKIEFNYNWTAETNPDIIYPDVPGDILASAHFSPLVVVSHNKYWTMWAPGGFANPGPEDIAELGDFTQLVKEMKRERNVFDFDNDEFKPFLPDAVVSLKVDVRGRTGQTYLSAMSMIAPSPDWFVGVYNVNVCYLGYWVEGPLKGTLYGWDAGTSKDGLQFTDKTDPRVPEKPLKRIKPLSKDFRPFGSVKIYKV